MSFIVRTSESGAALCHCCAGTLLSFCALAKLNFILYFFNFDGRHPVVTLSLRWTLYVSAEPRAFSFSSDCGRCSRPPGEPDRAAPSRPGSPTPRPAQGGDVSGGSDGRVPTERLPPQHPSVGSSAQHDRDEDPAVPGLPALRQRPQLFHLAGHHLAQPGRHGRVLTRDQELHGPVVGARLAAAQLLGYPSRN